MSTSQEALGDEGVELSALNGDSTRDASVLRSDRGKTAYLILLGCALQQLPVWGFQLAFGVIQEYEVNHRNIQGDRQSIGIVGTTLGGVIYISMPFVSALLTRYQGLSRTCAILGAVLTSVSLVVAAFSTEVWHLICSLGILHGVGAATLYTSTMMILNTWFIERKGLAFAVTLSTKALIGVATPLMFTQFLDRLQFRYTTLMWAGIAFIFSLPTALFLRPRSSTQTLSPNSPRRVPWNLIKCDTTWSFIFATTVFSAGYGLPQTYISSYASQVLGLSSTISSLFLAIMALLSVPASITFGILGDGNFRLRGRRINVHGVTALAALGSAISTFLFWGFSANTAILILFSITYGFFAGGYSAVWSGVMKEVARERPGANESDMGLVFGMLNGGRGIGFVIGGLIGARLLEESPVGLFNGVNYGYGSGYSTMILFTGATSVFGGSSLLWKAIALLKQA